mgnify:CR=1 FL=1
MRRRSTRTRRGFRVLIATDGSPAAQAALSTTCAFPWPRGSQVRGLVASPPNWIGGSPEYVRIASSRAFERPAAAARRRLAEHWPDAQVTVVEQAPADAILGAAKRFSSHVIVLGWRGHGTFRRLLMGSVSRDVVHRARVSVLVVRRRVRQIRRIVIGVDGSPNARRAVELAARLRRDAGTVIRVVRVNEPLVVPTAGRLPAAVRATILHNAAMLDKERLSMAQREADAAATRLRRAGWSARAEVRSGAPLAELLDVVQGSECDLLIVGARGAQGLRGALLGSVATGALNRSPASVLVVR